MLTQDPSTNNAIEQVHVYLMPHGLKRVHSLIVALLLHATIVAFVLVLYMLLLFELGHATINYDLSLQGTNATNRMLTQR